MDNKKIVEKLEWKWELVSYLNKLNESKNPFKKELTPPAKVVEHFNKCFKTWLSKLMAEAVGEQEAKAKPISTESQFTAVEVQFLRKLVAKQMARVTPGARSTVSVRKDDPAPTTLVEGAKPKPKRPRIGSKMYVIDASPLNNPDIDMDEEVELLNVNGADAIVRSVRKPSLQFSTSMNNLSPERI